MSLRPNQLNRIISRDFQAVPAPMVTIQGADFHIFLDDPPLANYCAPDLSNGSFRDYSVQWIV